MKGLGALVALITVCCGNSLEIKLPPGVEPETFFVRYVLAGQDFGGWVRPLAGVSIYKIEAGRSIGIKAILWAPGCAIQTLDLSLAQHNAKYSFICQPVDSIRIHGAVVHPDRLYSRGAKLQANYVSRWARRFLGLDEVLTIAIPIGQTRLRADGGFELVVPDLTQDARSGELQIIAKDGANEAWLAKLTPIEPRLVKARVGSMKVQHDYPAAIVFAQCVAQSTSGSAHDQFGFASRADVSERCEP